MKWSLLTKVLIRKLCLLFLYDQDDTYGRLIDLSNRSITRTVCNSFSGICLSSFFWWVHWVPTSSCWQAGSSSLHLTSLIFMSVVIIVLIDSLQVAAAAGASVSADCSNLPVFVLYNCCHYLPANNCLHTHVHRWILCFHSFRID